MTLSDKIEKAKFRRTQALMSKINILWARDGNADLEIESAIDVDDFNRKQLFGPSGNQEIDFAHVGVEGLIRCYYHISYLLKGTKRDNLIKNGTESLPEYCACNNANLEQASKYIVAGTPRLSGFYIDDNGNFGTNQSSFKSNKNTTAGDNDALALAGVIRSLASLIGNRSELGEKVFVDHYPSLSELMNHHQMLGKRNSDLYPYDEDSIMTQVTDELGNVSNVLVFTYYFGNGYYDNEYQSVSYNGTYSGTPNYWDQTWTNAMTNAIAKIDEVITYINYTKVSDTSHFINPRIIPGYNTSWDIQNSWIATLNEIKEKINIFLSMLNQHYPFEGNVNRTDPAFKAEIDAALDTLKNEMNASIANINAIHNYINPQGGNVVNLGAGFFGNPDDKGATLWGARAQWIKSILDVNDGTRVELKGIESAIETMNSTVSRAEEEYILIGLSKEPVSWANYPAWIEGISTPEILEIEYHQTIDKDEESETYLELINDGYIVSWTATAHATGYDIWRSLDWDGTNGRWIKLLPAGNDFCIQDINPNNGQVYNFYSDLSVDPNTVKPFYKVVTYDTGGVGDYSRIPAISAMSLPKNIDNFDGSSSGNTNNGAIYPPSGGTGHDGSSSDGSTPVYGSVTWREPVLNFSLLPMMGNKNCDVRLVLSEKTLYYWSSDAKEWCALSGYDNGSGGNSWKDPVEVISFLPTINNSDGDVRLVLSEGKLYRWDSEDEIWTKVESDAVVSINHRDLLDMPDDGGFNSDHDDRYYTHEEVDTRVGQISEQLDVLKYLIPANSAPLSGNLILTGREYQSGYLSHGYPDQQRFSTLNPEQYFTKIIKGGSITLMSSLEDREFNNADKGILQLLINGEVKDSFDLMGNFNEAKRTDIQTYTPKTSSGGCITITHVGMYLNYSLYQRGSYVVELSENVLVSGENSIQLVHIYDSVIDATPILTIFYDSSPDEISITNFDIRQNKLISSKYLSGLRYYSINDSLNISFKGLKLFNNTYILPDQISVNASELAIKPYSISCNSSGSTYEDFGQPFINAILASDEEKIITVKNVITSLPTIKAKGYNLKESQEFIYSEKVLINTYSPKSTDTSEFFVDEQYRLPIKSYDAALNTYKNVWKSSDIITASDLQVFCGKLIYPKEDFTLNYLPAQNISYYGLNGDRSYIRAFYDVSPHTNGVLYIKGYDMETCPYIKVEIKLPGQTGWLDVSTSYNEATFYGYDFDGCLINQDQFYYQYSTGSFSTANSGYMILVKVTMTVNNLNSIEEISIIW